MFPSPFGVCVLKGGLEPFGQVVDVSVPFRGLCSEMVISTAAPIAASHSVSVPFRGLCSEIRLFHGLLSDFLARFRPLSGFVF